MRFIHNLVVIDLKNEAGDILLANGINGLVDVVHRKERTIIEKWMGEEEIIPEGEEEKRLYELLEKRQYLLQEEEEERRKNQIIEKLRESRQQKATDSAWFVLTYRCNFHCPYCYENSVKREKTMTILFSLQPQSSK